MKLFSVLFALACLVPGLPAAIEIWPEDRPRTIGLICKYFCNDASYSYDLTDFYDYFDYWRSIDDENKPKILCKLCKKKMSTTTTTTTRGPSTTGGTSEGMTQSTASTTEAITTTTTKK